MTTPLRPAVVRCRDDRGRPVVKVPLDRFGRKWATLDADDFDALPDTLTLTWFLNASGPNRTYVKAASRTASGRLVRVARVILRARAGQWVEYETTDRTDLRRCNISLRRGGRAKRDDAALTAPLAAF